VTDVRDDPGGPSGGTLIELQPACAGRYRLVLKLGEGAMGEVWRGEDPQIGRAVAVKLLNVPRGLGPSEAGEWEARFLREARAAGSLTHPGIVAIHDVGRTEEGRPFIVMELVEGRSLDAILSEGPPPPAATALAWGAQVAAALDAAHRRGIVHRDIKPANILVDAEGRARIADFGIARVSESDLTREGVFLGSPAFTSPEQIRGEPVDGRADLFSLGSSLYALLTGVRPFKGADLTSLAYAVCHVEPDPPSRHAPSLPPSCDRILLRALAKDPRRRYQSGREMADDLAAAAAEAAPQAEAAPSSEAAPPAAGKTVAQAPPPGAKATAGAVGPGAPPPGVATLAARERKAAEVGSTAAILAVRAAAAAAASARAASRAAVAGMGRGWRAGRAAWERGWSRGPRARVAMVAGAVLALAAIAAGLFLLAGWIAEARRDTPGQKVKKAFRSLFSEARELPSAPGDPEVRGRA
jgi:serine/threonine-protein kinase